MLPDIARAILTAPVRKAVGLPRSGFAQILQDGDESRPFLRVARTEFVHEDEMVRRDSLVSSLPWSLMARGKGLALDMAAQSVL